MALGGMLLTGGGSTRMGRDKAALVVDGVPLATRLALLLRDVTEPTVEVGPGHTDLVVCREEPPGAGPLAAVGAGYRELRRLGLAPGSGCLVLACDLPLLDAALLDRLTTWPGAAAVLPVLGGFAQPLCARWSAEDLEAVEPALRFGERSLRGLPRRELAVLLDESVLGADASGLVDVDTPEDLERLGLPE